MEKRKKYPHVKFAPEVLQEAKCKFDDLLGPVDDTPESAFLETLQKDVAFEVQTEEEEWNIEEEAEFFAAYREKTVKYAHYPHHHNDDCLRVSFYRSEGTEVTVRAPQRKHIQAVFEVFEAHAAECRLPESSRPKVFLGHGRSPLWKELKDHLHEKHDYEIQAYEIGARAGHAIRDILASMMSEASIAFLIMTGEDKTSDGLLHPRQNVVHEIGLFQGSLGFSKAIAVVEEGTDVFSNLQGIEQIRFSKGRIRETFGDVLATIRREFPGVTSGGT